VWIKKKKPGLSMKKYEGGRVQEPQHLRISKKKSTCGLKKKSLRFQRRRARSRAAAVVKQ
jgi:hypothetical protein